MTCSTLTAFVGALLGDLEGERDGLTEGDPLGLFDGDCEGLDVGFAEGIVVTGLLDGELVIGALLGAREGDRLGLGVGCQRWNDVKEKEVRRCEFNRL